MQQPAAFWITSTFSRWMSCRRSLEVRDLDAISREVEDRLQGRLALDEQAQQGIRPGDQ